MVVTHLDALKVPVHVGCKRDLRALNKGMYEEI